MRFMKFMRISAFIPWECVSAWRQRCACAVKEASCALRHMSKWVASSLMETVVPLWSALVRLCLQYWVQSWAPLDKTQHWRFGAGPPSWSGAGTRDVWGEPGSWTSSALRVGDNRVSLQVEKMEPDFSWKCIMKGQVRPLLFTVRMVKHGNGPREVVGQFLGTV